MATVLTQRFCAVCGAEATADAQRFCPRCGAIMELVDDTKTIKYRPSHDIQEQESDATVRLSSPQKLYLKAQIEQATKESEKPALTVAPSEKYRPRQNIAKKLAQSTLLVRVGCVVGLVLILAGLLIGVMSQNNDPVAQRQANQSKAQLDALLQHGRTIGVPVASLQAIVAQEQQANHSYTPFVLVSHQSATSYYHTLTQRYHALSAQVNGTISTVTQQSQVQAQQDMQVFQTALSAGSTQNVGKNQSFAGQFSQDQFLLSSAQTPNDYAAISKSVRQSLQVLGLMTTTYTKLTDFHDTLTRMSSAHLDVTAMQSQYDNDVQLFNNATQAEDFQNLSTQIDVQYQQTVVTSI